MYGEQIETKLTRAEWDEISALLEKRRMAEAAAAGGTGSVYIKKEE